ncbi:MAG: hypothetical protein QM778_17875 [Myxococcales bacterium]
MAAPEAPAVVDVASELDLLGRARRVMPANPERALALANEHQSRYPSGVLAQERELLAVEALLKLRQRDEAERRSKQFSRDFPQSVHAPRLQALLEKREL